MLNQVEEKAGMKKKLKIWNLRFSGSNLRNKTQSRFFPPLRKIK